MTPSPAERRVETEVSCRARSRSTHLFLKGPIPLTWLQRAAALGSPALRVALGLWFQAGLKRSRELRASNRKLGVLGLSDRRVQRGLALLEAGGLIVRRFDQGDGGKARRILLLEGQDLARVDDVEAIIIAEVNKARRKL